MRSVLRLRLALAAIVVLGIVTACQLIAGIGDRVLYDGAVIDNPCSAPDLPALPTDAQPDPATPVDIVAALSKIMVGSTDGGPYYGFNLDSKCTCNPDPDSCTITGDAAEHCDDDGGIDDYARRAFERINLIAGAFVDGGVITEDRFNTALNSGLSGAIIEVTNYNGLADDANVRVTIYASQGYEGYPDAAPQHLGADKWIIDPGSQTGQYNTDNAYVTNYTLVAIGLNFPIIVGSAITQPVTIQLDEGVIRAQLDMSGPGNTLKSMSGVLGGRWDPAKFLPSLQSVPDPIPGSGTYLCGDASAITYPLLKSVICANTDINRSSAGDKGGPCNSVSMGLGFEAVPAKKSPTPGKYVDAGQPCGPNWNDSCN
jgi:hypothetical protein